MNKLYITKYTLMKYINLFVINKSEPTPGESSCKCIN